MQSAVDSGYEVVLPKYGMTRYYAGSNPIAVLPGLSLREVVDDPLVNFFARTNGRPTVAGCADTYATSATASAFRIDQGTGSVCWQSPMKEMYLNDGDASTDDLVRCYGNYVAYTDTTTATSGADKVSDCACKLVKKR